MLNNTVQITKIMLILVLQLVCILSKAPIHLESLKNCQTECLDKNHSICNWECEEQLHSYSNNNIQVCKDLNKYLAADEKHTHIQDINVLADYDFCLKKQYESVKPQWHKTLITCEKKCFLEKVEEAGYDFEQDLEKFQETESDQEHIIYDMEQLISSEQYHQNESKPLEGDYLNYSNLKQCYNVCYDSESNYQEWEKELQKSEEGSYCPKIDQLQKNNEISRFTRNNWVSKGIIVLIQECDKHLQTALIKGSQAQKVASCRQQCLSNQLNELEEAQNQI